MYNLLVLFGMIVGIVLPSYGFAGDDLIDLLEVAYKNNPGIASSKMLVEAEDSLVTSSATPGDPMIGVSTLDRNVRTRYGTITQKIKFPVKYYLQAKAQKSKVDSRRAMLELRKQKIRTQVITVYFSIYATQKITQLTKANIQAVRDFARVAEKKYAAGKSSQSDSMKAHFELTQLELDMIRLSQENDSLQDQMRALLNDNSFSNIDLHNKEIKAPKFLKELISESMAELTSRLKSDSPALKKEIHLLKEAESKNSLAKWQFAPDFQFQYQQRIAGDPTDSQIYSIGITVPLWFWKKGAEASAAQAYKASQVYRVESTTNMLVARVKDLKGKVETLNKTLRVYQTSLIPQAQGAYNSTRAGYRANKNSFLDLLDSERSLFRVRTGFFQSLRQYVDSLTQLEAEMGFPLSNIEKIKEVSK